MTTKWVPHVVKEGSREHVISYHHTKNGSMIKCSEPNCEINKPQKSKSISKDLDYGIW